MTAEQVQWSDSEVRQCSGHVQVRTSESKDHWQLYDSSAVLNLKFLNELAASNDRNFKFTALQHVPTAMNRDSQDTPEVRV